MVAKIVNGTNLYGVLSYNQKKVIEGEAVVLHREQMIYNITEDPKKELHLATLSFQPFLWANPNAKKGIVHISLNPAPGDEVSDENYVDLAKEYLEKMGFAGQPYIIYKHSDISREHIHIVTVRIREDGTRISDSFEHQRNLKVCRELEKKFGLTSALEKKPEKGDMMLTPVDYTRVDVRRQIRNTLLGVLENYSFQSWGEYSALLSCYRINSYVVRGEESDHFYRGVTYAPTDEGGKTAGTPIKSSRLGKAFGYEAIENKIKDHKEKVLKEKELYNLKITISKILRESLDKQDFINRLKEQSIDVVFRENDQGRLYGVTYVDHNNKNVLNGSRLGKEFSANALYEKFSRSVKNIKQPEKEIQESFILPTEMESFGESSASGLLELEQHGTDAQERAFYWRMRKRKNKHSRF